MDTIVHEGHTAFVSSVVFSPDGKSVVSGSSDRTVRMWDAHSSSPICEPLQGHNSAVNSVSYSPLGDLIASVSDDTTIRLWDTNTGQQSGEALKGNHMFYSVAFSPDGKLIASGSGGTSYFPTGSAIQLWDVQTKKAASGPLKGHTSSVQSVSFSLDGTRLASGSYDKKVRVWDVERRTTITGPLEGHTDWVRSTPFSPDGAQVSSCSDDGTIRIWDSRSGGAIGEPYKGHTRRVISVSYSPCGTYIASGGDGAIIYLWDTRTGRQLDQSFKEHTSTVNSVAFSPCGQYIASGSHDCTVVIRKKLGEGPDLDEDPGLDEELGSQMVTSQMSTQEMFQCLVDAGCNDLSPTMDTSQDGARIISGGGFGDIWMAELHDGTKVAIKAWRTDALEQCRYKTLKACPIDLDEYLGMVSEWMENGDLHKYLRYHPNADRHQLCIDVASGLEYMHGRNTVHGDLKAANVLVSPDGIARISDFDFSVMSEASNLVFTASSNNRAGSIRWVAPEMLDDEIPKRTTESDVYALGMTILEVFTGQVPYSERRLDAGVIKAVMQGILPTRSVQHFEDNEQGNLVWSLLLDCWSRNPSERPSAGKVVRILGSRHGKT